MTSKLHTSVAQHHLRGYSVAANFLKGMEYPLPLDLLPYVPPVWSLQHKGLGSACDLYILQFPHVLCHDHSSQFYLLVSLSLAAAEQYLEESLGILQVLHGPHHPKTLAIQDDLCKLMLRTDRSDVSYFIVFLTCW